MDFNAEVDHVQVGARIKRIREYRDMRQCELARKIGKSDVYMSQAESGKKGYKIKTLSAIAAALGVTVDVLLGDREFYEDNQCETDQAG